MISRSIQKKLLGIIKEKMIPEYKNSILYKENLKEEYVKYLNGVYMTEKDRYLISKYSDLIKLVDRVPIAYYRNYSSGGEDIKLEHFNNYMIRDANDMIIELDSKLPNILDTIYRLIPSI